MTEGEIAGPVVVRHLVPGSVHKAERPARGVHLVVHRHIPELNIHPFQRFARGELDGTR
ncbi:MAG: hypothetical protein MZV64_31480 [Ignavibacteriales bacterium]|nr:hypothetical protein [Ignavibacteriales bacterium]